MSVGEPLVPALTAIGKWLGDRVRQSVSEQSGPGQKLEGLTSAATAGRKLMQVTGSVQNFGTLPIS